MFAIRETQLARRVKQAELFFFSFPSPMIMGGPHPLRQNLKVGSAEVTVYPPLQTSNPDWRALPPLTRQAISIISAEIAAFKNLPLNSSVVPFLTKEGKIALSGEPVTSNRNTVALSVRSVGSQEERTSIARDFLDRAMQWCRILTHQWWCGRLISTGENPLRLTAELSSDFVPTGKVHSMSNGIRLHRMDILPIDLARWQLSCKRAAIGQVPGLADIAIDDVFFQCDLDDDRSTVILACGFLETIMDAAFEREGITAVDLKIGAYDPIGKVAKGMQKLRGISLENDRPSLFFFLKSLVGARGLLAHGKNLMWLSDKNLRNLPSDFGDQYRQLVEWIAGTL